MYWTIKSMHEIKIKWDWRITASILRSWRANSFRLVWEKWTYRFHSINLRCRRQSLYEKNSTGRFFYSLLLSLSVVSHWHLHEENFYRNRTSRLDSRVEWPLDNNLGLYLLTVCCIAVDIAGQWWSEWIVATKVRWVFWCWTSFERQSYIIHLFIHLDCIYHIVILWET